MAAPGTSFAGPIISGPRQNADTSGPANVGYAVLTQTALLTQAGTVDQSATFTIPEHCQILDFLADTSTAWNSATSALLTIGTAALGAQYVASVSIASVGRLTLPATAAATLAALADTGTNKSVVATIDVTGATTTGVTRITMRYVQTTAWMS